MAGDVRAERAAMDGVVEGKTLCSAFAATVERLGDAPALSWPSGAGRQELTWRGYRREVQLCALGLRAVGFGAGEFAAIMARNRAEHLIADLGVVHARGIPVSLYNTSSQQQLAYVLAHCEATVAVVEDSEFLAKILGVRDQLPRLRTVVVMEPVGQDAAGVISWSDVLAAGAAHPGGDGEFEAMWSAVAPDDPGTVVYTSGTTGPPKGVVLTHRNILWTMEAVSRAVPPTPEEELLCYLPLAHALERWWSHWNAAVHGVRIHLCPDSSKLLVHLRDVRPTWFFGVPRVWEKLQAGIMAGIAAQPDQGRRDAVQQVIDVGRQVVLARQGQESLPDELARRWEAGQPVRQAVLAQVGLDRCRLSASGGAPLGLEVVIFFNALGLPLYEGWGMTELTGTGTFMGFENVRIDTVGRPLPGVEMRVADDGELLVRGGNVMAGYYKDEATTAQALTDDGWLATGDLAEIDADGYCRVVGRKKEIIITTGGKNVSPANLERLLHEHPLVGHACVIGDARPYVSALIVLDPELATAWAAHKGVEVPSPGALVSHPELLAEIQGAVERANARLSRAEQIRAYRVLPDTWTVAGGELTPTLKMKRDLIVARYAEEIDSMYVTSSEIP